MIRLHRAWAPIRRGWRSLRSLPAWRRLGDRLTSPRVAVQVTAVVIGAVLAGVVAVQYSGASGTWQQAVREESKRSSLWQEQVRAVYEDEAPLAVRVAAAQARTDALRALASRSQPAAAERVVSRQLAFTMSRSAAPGSLAAGRDYALPDGGFDVARRLADLVRTEPAGPDPDRTAADGDRQAAFAAWLSLLTVVITGLAVALAALPIRFRHGGSDGEPGSPDDEPASEPEIIPQPAAAHPEQRRVGYVLLALWTAGVLLPFAQLALGWEETRSQAAAARTVVAVTGEIAIGQTRAAFAAEAQRTALFGQAVPIARQLAALDLTDARVAAEQWAIADAENAAAARTQAFVAAMSEPPAAGDVIDRRLAAALASGPEQWKASQAIQVDQAARAETFGAWSNASVAVIAVVAALTAIIEVTASSPEQRREPPAEPGTDDGPAPVPG